MRAAVALGGNLPGDASDCADMLRRGVAALGKAGVKVVAFSRIWRSPAFPAGAGPDYANAAAVIEVAGDDPQALLALLHRVEADLGRVRGARWAGRVLDLDLLAVEDRVLPDLATFDHWRNLAPEDQVRLTPERLILPHPRMQDRAFVLVPLAEVAPDWVHPVLGQSVAAMLAALPAQDVAALSPWGQA